MATGKADGKRRLNYYDVEEEEEEEEEEEQEEEDEDGDGELGFGGDFNKKKKIVAAASSNKRSGSGYGGGAAAPSCQADNCNADLSGSKRYHRRHKVCEFHAKAPAVAVAGIHQRFCQQCSRYFIIWDENPNLRSASNSMV